eukprot:sb/3472912/
MKEVISGLEHPPNESLRSEIGETGETHPNIRADSIRSTSSSSRSTPSHSEDITSKSDVPDNDRNAELDRSEGGMSPEREERSPMYDEADISIVTSETCSSPSKDPDQPHRERGSTITKKIPLSEFATLQGILAHQVDEGAPCLKCGPETCSGLDLHFWK